MLNKKHASALRPPMASGAADAPAPSDMAAEGEEDEDMDDLFGDPDEEAEGDESPLAHIDDDTLISEFRKRGLSLDTPAPKKGRRFGADDADADPESYS